MILIISPAKKLRTFSVHPKLQCSETQFLSKSQILAQELKTYTAANIAKRMKISAKLAELNLQRYLDWKLPFNTANAKPAILYFDGDVYSGLDAHNLSNTKLHQAQKNIRILSGLYGILKPLDLIMAYRLEMGTRLPIKEHKDLYSFWGDDITDYLNNLLATHKYKFLINLASNEYFKSIKTAKLKHQIITPIFKDWKKNEYKIISFFAKKARGMMCRFMLENDISKPDELKNFDSAGYKFCKQQSTDTSWVFTRK